MTNFIVTFHLEFVHCSGVFKTAFQEVSLLTLLGG